LPHCFTFYAKASTLRNSKVAFYISTVIKLQVVNNKKQEFDKKYN